MIIVVPSCLKDADGTRTCSDQNVYLMLWVFYYILYFFPTCLAMFDEKNRRLHIVWSSTVIGPSVHDQAVSLSDDGTTIIIDTYNRTLPAYNRTPHQYNRTLPAI